MRRLHFSAPRSPLQLILFLCLCRTLAAQGTYTVTSSADTGSAGTLRWAITQANANPGSTINLNNNLGTITLGSALPIVTSAVTINGGSGNTLSGAGQHRILFVDAPSAAVSINNLTLANGYVQGGNGGSGVRGGGGGLGAGGAIFVNAGNVSLASVQLNNNQAVGGAGGNAVAGSGTSGGGGGGLGGDGGHGLGGSAGGGGGGFLGDGGNTSGVSSSQSAGGGGGGLLGNGAAGNERAGGGGGGSVSNGQQGVITATEATGGLGGTSNGGNGGNGDSASGAPSTSGSAGGTGGGGGGAGQSVYGNGGTSHGGDGGAFGGGGGAGHIGQAGNGGDFGGGGGTGDAGNGGDGGFGGGGGASGDGKSAGAGGFGGGSGGGTSMTAGTYGGTGHITQDLYYRTGGGGAALGGDIFVRSENGATLTFTDTASSNSSAVAGAAGAAIGTLYGVTYFGTSAQAHGSAFFLMSGSTSFDITGTSEITGSIGEAPGAGVAVTKTGAGTLIFSGNNTYTGATTISAGTLQLGNGGTSGSLAGNIVNSSRLALNHSGNLTLAGNITGGGELRQFGSATVTFTGNVALGTVQIDSGGLAFAGATTTTGDITSAGTLTLSGAVTANSIAQTGSALNFSGATMTGNIATSGTTVQFTGQNTLNSPITLSGGSTSIAGNATFNGNLTVNTDLSLSTSNIDGSGTFVVNGGTIRAAGDVRTLANPLTLAGNFTLGRFTHFTGATALAANVTITANNSDGPANANSELRGVISGNHALTFAEGAQGIGTGAIVLTGTNTYTGGTTLQSGRVSIDRDANLGAASGTLTFSGGTLATTANITTTRNIAVASGGGRLEDNGRALAFGTLSGNGTLTKDGAGTLTFSDAATFTGTFSYSSGSLKLASGGTLNLQPGTLASGAFINDGTLVASGSSAISLANVTLSGTGAFTKSDTGLVTLGSYSPAQSLTINDGTVSFAGNHTRTFVGASGTGALSLDGGTLSLANGSVFLTGGMTQNAGTFTVSTASTLSAFTLNAGTLTASTSNIFSSAPTLNGGTLRANAANVFSHDLVVNGSTLEIGHDDALANLSNPITFNSGGLRAGGARRSIGQTLLLNGNITLGRYTDLTGSIVLGNNVTLTSTNPDNGSFAESRITGSISGAHSLTIAAGTTTDAIYLSGNNTFSGGLVIRSPYVRITSADSLGTGPITLDGGTFTSDVALSTSRILIATANGGTLNSNNLSSTFGGVQATGSFVIYGVDTETVTFTGASTVAGELGFTFGRLTLSPTATLTAATVDLNGDVDAGILRLEGNATSRGVLSTAQVTALSNPEIFAAELTFAGGILQATGSHNTFVTGFPTTAINIESSGAFIDSNGYAIRVPSRLNGTGALTKLGTGTLTLAAANTYSGGTTISAGTLQPTHSSALGTGAVSVSGTGATLALSSLTIANAVTVQSGGRLQGTGGVGALTIGSGGVLSPGASPGTLTAGNTTFAGGGGFLWEINDATGTAGANWDLLSISGSLTIAATSGSPFTIALTSLTLANATGSAGNFNPASNYAFDFVTASGGISGFTTDAFTLDTSGFQHAFSGTWSIASSANALSLTYTASAIPEPSTYAALAGVATLGLALFRRRRANQQMISEEGKRKLDLI